MIIPRTSGCIHGKINYSMTSGKKWVMISNTRHICSSIMLTRTIQVTMI